jgi:hypothetical protein
MIPDAEDPVSQNTIGRSRLRQLPNASDRVAVIRKARPICQRDSCNGPTRPDTASMNMAEAAKATAAARERATASMTGQSTCAMAAASTGTVFALRPAMLIRLSPTM